MSDELKPSNQSIIDFLKIKEPQFDLTFPTQQTQAINAVVEGIYQERLRKEEAEEAYQQETIRSLNAIEQNTANLFTLVDLISNSNEQQDEIISIITDGLTIAKAKSKSEAKTAYKKVMGRITQTINDVETITKMTGYVMTVWQLLTPIIDKLPK